MLCEKAKESYLKAMEWYNEDIKNKFLKQVVMDILIMEPEEKNYKCKNNNNCECYSLE